MEKEICKCNRPDCKKCRIQKLEETNKKLLGCKQVIRQLAIKQPIRQLAADSVRAQIICLDFDGVMNNHDHNKNSLGELVPGFREFFNKAT